MENKKRIDLLKFNLLKKKQRTDVERVALKILNSEFKVIEAEKKEIEVKAKVFIKNPSDNLIEEWWISYFFELDSVNETVIRIYKLNNNNDLESIF